jgi:hypothetical protein
MTRPTFAAQLTLWNMLFFAIVASIRGEEPKESASDFAMLKEFQTLARNDPARAAERAVKLKASQRPTAVLNIVLEPWTAKDADAAMAWARSLPKSKESAGYIQLMGMSGKSWPTEYTWCREHAEQIVRFHSGKPVVDAPPALRDRGHWYWDKRGHIVVYSFDELKQVTDDDLAHIGNLPHLQTLNAHSNQVTSDGLKHLAGLKKLGRLSIRCPEVTDAGLEHLRPLQNLQSLDLGRSSITGPGLETLKHLPHLRTLTLSGTKVTDSGLKHIRDLHNLVVLQLCYTVANSEAGRIVKSDAVDISDAGLAHLADLMKLRSLDVRGTRVTAEGAERLKKSLTKTRILFGDSSAH